MKRIFTTIIAIIVMAIGVVAQNTQSNEKSGNKESRVELLNYLTSLPDVSVTYLSKSMIQKIPNKNPDSPLGLLISNGGVSSVRVFELGTPEAETAGKKLMNSYISEFRGKEPELLMFQKDTSNEIQIYGLPYINDIYKFNRVIMYSKMQRKKALLIILSGSIPESSIGQLIDSYSK